MKLPDRNSKLRMGQTKSQFTEEELQDYEDLTYFTKKEILLAHKKFKGLAPEKVGHNKNARLSMNKILQYPELKVNFCTILPSNETLVSFNLR